MKGCSQSRYPGNAFTLIEILVVLAIVAILAGLFFSVGSNMKKREQINVAQTELAKVKLAIESYKTKRGHYPPDNPGNPAINPLYFELKGVVLTMVGGQPVYVTIDGNSRIAGSDIPVVFGPSVNSFINYPKNSTAPASDDEAAALQFLRELRPTQIGQLVIGAQAPANALLLCSVRGTDDPAQQVIPAVGNPHAVETGLNPWRYVSSNPTNNPQTYDLWVDLRIGGKTFRVNNWSTQPEEH